MVRSVLAGERGPVRETVLLNAGAALVADGGAAEPGRLATALAGGYARAVEAVDSGAAASLLDTWIQASRRLAS